MGTVVISVIAAIIVRYSLASHIPHARHPRSGHQRAPRPQPSLPKAVPLGVPTGVCKKERRGVRGAGVTLLPTRVPPMVGGAWGGPGSTVTLSQMPFPPAPIPGPHQPVIATCTYPTQKQLWLPSAPRILEDAQVPVTVDPCPPASPSSPYLWSASMASSLFVEHILVPGLYVPSPPGMFFPGFLLGWLLTQIPNHPIQR